MVHKRTNAKTPIQLDEGQLVFHMWLPKLEGVEADRRERNVKDIVDKKKSKVIDPTRINRFSALAEVDEEPDFVRPFQPDT